MFTVQENIKIFNEIITQNLTAAVGVRMLYSYPSGQHKMAVSLVVSTWGEVVVRRDYRS